MSGAQGKDRPSLSAVRISVEAYRRCVADIGSLLRWAAVPLIAFILVDVMTVVVRRAFYGQGSLGAEDLSSVLLLETADFVEYLALLPLLVFWVRHIAGGMTPSVSESVRVSVRILPHAFAVLLLYIAPWLVIGVLHKPLLPIHPLTAVGLCILAHAAGIMLAAGPGKRLVLGMLGTNGGNDFRSESTGRLLLPALLVTSMPLIIVYAALELWLYLPVLSTLSGPERALGSALSDAWFHGAFWAAPVRAAHLVVLTTMMALLMMQSRQRQETGLA